MLRRSLPALVAIGALACEPSAPFTPPTSSVNFAVYNPQTGQIPQPNDISLQAAKSGQLADNAQTELLVDFANQGGFPSDQALPVTIEFQRTSVQSNGTVTFVAPDLDTSTLVANMTLVALQANMANQASPIQLDPITPADYVVSGDHGTLTLHNKGNAPWPAGQRIIIAVRGGPDGVLTKSGEQFQAAPTFYLLLGNQDLSLPQNNALLPGTRAQRQQEGAQLEAIRKLYQPIFMGVDALFFPHTQLISLTTFQIAPATTHVATDAAAGQIPVPSDFLLDASGKHVQNIPAFGPLAAGLATLDGFSTTAPITAQTTAPILASTVNKNTVLLYDLSNPSQPVRVPDATTQPGGVYETEPAQVTQMVGGASVSNVIVLQPAVPFASANGAVALPPLKESTEYAVVITNGVQDTSQKGLTPTTISDILLLSKPVVDSSGNSQLAGVSNEQAQTLEKMRSMLQPVIKQAQTDANVSSSQIAIAYTFRTQSVTGATAVNNSSAPPGNLQLAALPYADAQASKNFVPTMPNVLTPADAFAKYGVDQSIVPLADIGAIYEAKMPTVNLLSDATGAFDPTKRTPEVIDVLMAVPKPDAVPMCPSGVGFPMGARCAPLVVFHHGLGRARGDMLTVADSLTKKGFVVAAIDSPKHGDRSWCSNDAQCANGGTCTPIPGAATQGDATPPGICSAGLKQEPVLCATPECLAAWETAMPQAGIAAVSSNYLVSANLFRVRDTFRQDVLDNSVLILALARPPALPMVDNPVTTQLGMSGIVINPAEVYWEGQSLGSILGTLNVASNPRISRAALNVGGGTVVDVLLNSPAFQGQTTALLSSLGIMPGTSQYLQFVLVAKWIMDPAEPVNFAGHILGDATHPTLPDLLNMKPSQAGKPTLAQVAACDMVVPNAFNLELDQLIGLGPKSMTQSTLTLFENTTDAGGACPFGVAAMSPGTVPHGFLTDWGVTFSSMGVPSVSMDVHNLTQLAQDQNAAFLTDPTQLPPPVQTQP